MPASRKKSATASRRSKSRRRRSSACAPRVRLNDCYCGPCHGSGGLLIYPPSDNEKTQDAGGFDDDGPEPIAIDPAQPTGDGPDEEHINTGAMPPHVSFDDEPPPMSPPTAPPAATTAVPTTPPHVSFADEPPETSPPPAPPAGTTAVPTAPAPATPFPPTTTASLAGLDDIRVRAAYNYDVREKNMHAVLGVITNIGDVLQPDTAVTGFITPSEYQENDCDTKSIVQEAKACGVTYFSSTEEELAQMLPQELMDAAEKEMENYTVFAFVVSSRKDMPAIFHEYLQSASDHDIQAHDVHLFVLDTRDKEKYHYLTKHYMHGRDYVIMSNPRFDYTIDAFMENHISTGNTQHLVQEGPTALPYATVGDYYYNGEQQKLAALFNVINGISYAAADNSSFHGYITVDDIQRDCGILYNDTGYRQSPGQGNDMSVGETSKCGMELIQGEPPAEHVLNLLDQKTAASGKMIVAFVVSNGQTNSWLPYREYLRDNTNFASPNLHVAVINSKDTTTYRFISRHMLGGYTWVVPALLKPEYDTNYFDWSDDDWLEIINKELTPDDDDRHLVREEDKPKEPDRSLPPR